MGDNNWDKPGNSASKASLGNQESQLDPRRISLALTDTVSEAESLSDDERIRRLFALCDGDGDGYIDCNDLTSALQDLGLDDALDVKELMKEMGAGVSGKVSFEQFMQCRLAHNTEIEALRYQGATERYSSLDWPHSDKPKEPDYLPTSSEHSLGAVSGRHESWEFDSGARDLSPEPHTLQRLIEAAGGSLSGSTTNMLELANKLHLAALSSLKNEIVELSTRLQRTCKERDNLEQNLAKAQLERLRLSQQSEERLERQATQYEERLTELHSVIAELSRKLDRQNYTIIREEGEEGDSSPVSGSKEEGEEDDEDEESVDDVDVPLEEPKDDDKDGSEAGAVQSSDSESEVKEKFLSSHKENYFGREDLDDKAREAGQTVHELERCERLQEMLVALQSENAVLQQTAFQHRAELEEAKSALCNLRQEKERLQNQLRDVTTPEHASCSSPQPRPLPLSATGAMGSLARYALYGERSDEVTSPVILEEGPVCKVAERVRLRRLESRERGLTGSEIVNLGVRDTRIAEQLIASLSEESMMQEVRHGTQACDVSPLRETKFREMELEIERLANRAEHFRAQNDLLALTLAESRALGERLAVLLGKYESNCTALKLALDKAGHVSEAYEVLATLVESEMSLLLANCQVAGIGHMAASKHSSGSRKGREADFEGEENARELSVLWKKATDRRKAAESLARKLLSKHGRNEWEEGQRTNTLASSTSSGAETGSGSGASLEPTERKVRDLIYQLKSERAAMESTLQALTLPMEPALINPYTPEVMTLPEARKIDLEMAVLMQELMAMREERAKLRSQLFEIERERVNWETQEQTYLAHVRLLQSQINEGLQTAKDGLPYPDASSREAHLRARIQELLTTLERVTQSSELRHQQSTEVTKDLKSANRALMQMVEKTKKKYLAKLKRLEQQMVNMSERHAMQVRVLKQRIMAIEDEASQRLQPLSSAPSETSL